MKKHNYWDSVRPDLKYGFYQGRPSDEEIEIWERIFLKVTKKKSKLKILILGATPCLRDLGIKYRHSVYLIDISLAMIEKMGKLMKYYEGGKEKIVNANWLDMPFEDNYFDIVMGDLVFQQLMPDEHEAVMKHINRVLKKDGYFLCRERMMENLRFRTFKEYAEEFRQGKIKWWDFRYMGFLLNSDMHKWYDKKKRLFYWKNYFRELKKAYKRGELTKEEFDSCNRSQGNVVNYLLKKEEHMFLFREYFDVLERIYCKDYEICKTSPFFVAMPKKELRPWDETVKVYNNWTFHSMPSPEQWEIFEEIAKKIAENRKKKALILGATPKLREILAKNTYEVTCVDISPIMIQAMNHIVKKDYPKIKDKVVCEDWFMMELGEKFDLVISDCPLQNIPFKRYKGLFKKVFEHLNPNGYFLFRSINVPSLRIKGDVRYFIGLYRKGKIKFEDLYSFLEYYSDIATFDKKNRCSDHIVFFKRIDECHKEGKLNDEEYRRFNLIRHNVITIVPTTKEIMKASKEHFEIIETLYANDFVTCKDSPIYLMKKINGY